MTFGGVVAHEAVTEVMRSALPTVRELLMIAAGILFEPKETN